MKQTQAYLEARGAHERKRMRLLLSLSLSLNASPWLPINKSTHTKEEKKTVQKRADNEEGFPSTKKMSDREHELKDDDVPDLGQRYLTTITTIPGLIL